MKKTIAIFCLSALIGASVQTASAGDREWATVGKVLTGVAAVHVLSQVLQPPPVYTTAVYAGPPPVYSIAPVAVVAPAPVVPAAPVYLQPPPVVVYPRPVYVTPAPVYLAPGYWPAPAVSLSFGFGYGHRPRYHCR
ncbi:MAG TPA: hypothetical protein VEO53_12920 [Candidatus Binatia bacterium]|nr:hypothetical protein [Candidatus Binatia bacterium]